MQRISGRVRRGLAITGLALALVVGALVVSGADVSAALGSSDNADQAHDEPASDIHQTGLDPDQVVYGWSATSPAIDLGDDYTLTITNGATPTRVWVRVVIMDHMNEKNLVVIGQAVDLAAGETRVLTTTNDYGPANHFNTVLISESPDIALDVSISDDTGQIAWFNERAFMPRETTVAAWLSRRPMHEGE